MRTCVSRPGFCRKVTKESEIVDNLSAFQIVVTFISLIQLVDRKWQHCEQSWGWIWAGDDECV